MTVKFVITGLVQGVGFRPFVAELAEKLNIVGNVRNSGGIVTVMTSAEEATLRQFKKELLLGVPDGGFITEIKEEKIKEAEVFDSFEILESDEDIEENLPFVPSDIATCKDCEAELLDKNNRRYGHPFISCTICGPRYSIIRRLPYDRNTITMDEFEMCPDCLDEYKGKGNKRRHAQTIACKSCGPVLEGTVEKAAEIIRNGGIVAIKDIGGYHLACNPFNEEAVALLRRLKHREAKAFAVMFENIEQVKEYAFVNSKEAELLLSPARPIVLVRKSNDLRLAKGVCLSSPDIGAMLPCNPLQILLIRECGPLVMTSGNGSGDVLEINDESMRAWMEERFSSEELKGGSFYILSHNREILRSLDDSVMKVVAGRQQFIRRGRGYVPSPIAVDIKGEIFAGGGDLKSSFCYVKNGLAFVSQYLGDLESISCQNSYKKEMNAMKVIFGFSPDKRVMDKHPGYYSRKLSEGEIEIQHHMAHVASVIAEHNIKGDVLGFAFDGTGFGDDGSIWGSEVFKWNGKSMERVMHLRPVKLIGGDEGAKNCQTIFEGYQYSLDLDAEDTITAKAIEMGINTVTSTSMGRLFDAVSFMLGIQERNNYEGQAAIELENMAARTTDVYPLLIADDGDTAPLFRGLKNALDNGYKAPELARGFIYAVADFIYTQARIQGIKNIVLAGGTFLNRILTERTVELLESDGFSVFMSEQLPPGDGGICLGQAYLAALEDM